MSNPLSVDSTFLTVLGYQMSYIEFVGTVLYVLSVWLIARRNMLTWPIGIVSVLLYMVIFFQIRLYSDTLEQVYILARVYMDGGIGRNLNQRNAPSATWPLAQ